MMMMSTKEAAATPTTCHRIALLRCSGRAAPSASLVWLALSCNLRLLLLVIRSRSCCLKCRSSRPSGSRAPLGSGTGKNSVHYLRLSHRYVQGHRVYEITSVLSRPQGGQNKAYGVPPSQKQQEAEAIHTYKVTRRFSDFEAFLNFL